MNFSKHHPPRRAEKLLEWFIRDELAEEVLGDLEEKFYAVLEEKSAFRAKMNYWYQVFNYLRPFAIRRKKPSYSNQYAMFRNYSTVAWRNLLKHKMYSFIKIGGFALGIAACLLISLYIRDELSYDKQYADSDRIFRMINTETGDENIQKWTAFAAPIKEVMENDFPEVEMVGRLIPFDWYDAGNNQVRREDDPTNLFEQGFVYGDPELLAILEIPMVAGSRENALDEPNSVVITQRKADKLFPGEDAVGKTLILNDNEERPYKITGIIQNRPANSHLQFDYMLTLSGVEFWNGEQASWCCSNYNPYIKVKEGVDFARL
ncbi:MAG: ABC transporter permease [Bacteroidetes bacterium]|nr:ABC transporter permease [Bacteroidota bacterium]